MNKFKEIAVSAVLGGGFIGAIGGGITHTADSFDQTRNIQGLEASYEDAIPPVREQVRREGELILQVSDEIADLKQQLGELCVTTLGAYMPEAPLADVSDESATNTVMLDARHQCGTDPTVVRTNIVNWRTANTRLATAQRDAGYNQGHLERMERDQREDDVLDYAMPVGSWLGLLSALGIGVTKFLNIRADERRWLTYSKRASNGERDAGKRSRH
jgi:hypothetical protein